MDISQSSKPWLDEVLRKIGRNLLLLQSVEAMFKTLLTHSRVSGATPEEIERYRAKRKKLIESQTLGMLAGVFTTEVLAGKEMPANQSKTEFPAIRVSTTFELEAEDDYIAQRTASLQLIVDERNELVHHFLSKWDLASQESADAANRHLDQQHSRVAEEAKTLKSNVEALQQLAGLSANLMSSPEFEQEMEKLWLYDSRIVQLLVSMSQEAVGQDGWVRLADAGQLLWSKAPEDMASLKARYGYDKLKPLLLATEVFDLRDEPLPNGGSGVLFKLKPEAKALFDAS